MASNSKWANQKIWLANRERGNADFHIQTEGVELDRQSTNGMLAYGSNYGRHIKLRILA